MDKIKHTVTTVGDIANLLTSENYDYVMADLAHVFRVIVKINEKIKQETGEYPRDILQSIDIVFDGKIGCDKVVINGETFNIIN